MTTGKYTDGFIASLKSKPEKVKDELITFLGSSPMFKAFEADLPIQMGQTIELRDYQQEAIDNLKKMREDGKTFALLYHATGVGKTRSQLPRMQKLWADERSFWSTP